MQTETELEFVARWKPIVVAAEMYDPSQNPLNLYFLAGAITHDELVHTRHATKLAAWKPSRTGVFAPSKQFYLEVLHEMTKAEREELAQRITRAKGLA